MNRKFTARKKNSKDNSLLITIFSLLAFGFFMIANSTIITSEIRYGDPYKFAIFHLGWIIIGTVCFLFFYNYDYHKLGKLAYTFILASFLFLGFLAIVGVLPCSENFIFAPCVNGANRWLYLNPPPLPQIPFLGVAGFQPGEFAKLAIIMYLSFQLTKLKGTKENLFKVYVTVAGLTAGLVLLQPNMSTAAMIFLISTIIYFSSGASVKPLFVLFPSLFILGIGAVLLSPYRRARLLTLISGSESGDLSAGYHIHQILLSLGSGGFFGVGFGQSKQKYQYLPEVASDSIFALIGEEFGFLGTTLLICAFGFLIYKGFTIAKNSPDMLGKLLSTGVIAWIGLQFCVNVSAMTKIIPLTGVPMPLISYGGSSMVFSMMGLGILANVQKLSKR